MISVELSEEDLLRTRLAYSPLWETVASFALAEGLKGEPSEWEAWSAEVRPALAGLDLEPLRVLLRVRGYIPDFLLPPPSEAAPRFEDELARLRATPPQQVQTEVRLAYPGDTPGPLAPYVDDPERALENLARLLERYWDLVLAGRWPRLRTLLEGELLVQADRLTREGPESLLASLGPRFRWRAPVLEVDKHHEEHVRCDGRGLLLVPLVFGGSAFVSIEGPWRPTVSYAARGTAAIWGSRVIDEDREAPLELLLGRGRAAVLGALEEASTTSALALRLGLSPSTVSEHLAVLDRAGVVRRRRVGRRVVYRLTERGSSLLELLAAELSAARSA